MGIRLNKVLSELNIGLQTAVEYLKKKTELGEVKDDVTTNTKISDEQYEALVDAFSGDKDVKTKAEQLFTKKTKEKKVEKKVTKAEELLEQRPQFKPLGKIDLDNIGKPKAAEPVKTAVEKEPEVKEAAVADTESHEEPAQVVAPAAKETTETPEPDTEEKDTEEVAVIQKEESHEEGPQTAEPVQETEDAEE